VPSALAITIAVSFFIVLFVMFRIPVPEANRDAVHILLGMLEGALLTVLNFEFGSSRSSRDKDAVLGRVADAASNGRP